MDSDSAEETDDDKENASENVLLQDKVTPSRLSCLQELRDEFSCSICLDICVRPCTTPCGHSFCRGCLRTALLHSTNCPKCRTQLPPGCALKINTSMWNAILLLFPSEADVPPTPSQDPCTQARALTGRPHMQLPLGRMAQDNAPGHSDAALNWLMQEISGEQVDTQQISTPEPNSTSALLLQLMSENGPNGNRRRQPYRPPRLQQGQQVLPGIADPSLSPGPLSQGLLGAAPAAGSTAPSQGPIESELRARGPLGRNNPFLRQHSRRPIRPGMAEEGQVRQATPPRHAAPPRDATPTRQATPPRHATPPRQATPPRNPTTPRQMSPGGLFSDTAMASPSMQNSSSPPQRTPPGSRLFPTPSTTAASPNDWSSSPATSPFLSPLPRTLPTWNPSSLAAQHVAQHEAMSPGVGDLEIDSESDLESTSRALHDILHVSEGDYTREQEGFTRGIPWPSRRHFNFNAPTPSAAAGAGAMGIADLSLALHIGPTSDARSQATTHGPQSTTSSILEALRTIQDNGTAPSTGPFAAGQSTGVQPAANGRHLQSQECTRHLTADHAPAVAQADTAALPSVIAQLRTAGRQASSPSVSGRQVNGTANSVNGAASDVNSGSSRVNGTAGGRSGAANGVNGMATGRSGVTNGVSGTASGTNGTAIAVQDPAAPDMDSDDTRPARDQFQRHFSRPVPSSLFGQAARAQPRRAADQQRAPSPPPAVPSHARAPSPALERSPSVPGRSTHGLDAILLMPLARAANTRRNAQQAGWGASRPNNTQQAGWHSGEPNSTHEAGRHATTTRVQPGGSNNTQQAGPATSGCKNAQAADRAAEPVLEQHDATKQAAFDPGSNEPRPNHGAQPLASPVGTHADPIVIDDDEASPLGASQGQAVIPQGHNRRTFTDADPPRQHALVGIRPQQLEMDQLIEISEVDTLSLASLDPRHELFGNDYNEYGNLQQHHHEDYSRHVYPDQGVESPAFFDGEREGDDYHQRDVEYSHGDCYHQGRDDQYHHPQDEYEHRDNQSEYNHCNNCSYYSDDYCDDDYSICGYRNGNDMDSLRQQFEASDTDRRRPQRQHLGMGSSGGSAQVTHQQQGFGSIESLDSPRDAHDWFAPRAAATPQGQQARQLSAPASPPAGQNSRLPAGGIGGASQPLDISRTEQVHIHIIRDQDCGAASGGPRVVSGLRRNEAPSARRRQHGRHA